MSNSISDNLTIEEAVTLLKKYSCESEQTDIQGDRHLLRQALLLIIKESEWENIGVCADNPQQGLEAVKSYLTALGYQDKLTEYTTDKFFNEAVYIKFNTQKMSYYIDSYTGNYRGVLVALQGDDDRVVGTYGYFPLDLYE